VNGDDAALRMAEKSMVVELLKAQFGSAALNADTGRIAVTIPSNQVSIDWENDEVACDPADEALHARITTCLDRMRAALERIQPRELSDFDSHTVGPRASA
jgi:Pre-mRNA 3'-end-processing endonuclease polyadenylation factor C-term